MTIEARRKPYIWTTWISGLLGGDKYCEWSAWFRAHYNFAKRPESPDQEDFFTRKKAEHAVRVFERSRELEADGWSVRVEDANKFSYRGKVAIVGGCPDVVATRDCYVRIDDAKTGKARESDFWQVAIYATLLPLVDASIAELVTVGAVVYNDRVREISPTQLVDAQRLIVERVHRVAGHAEPQRRPSASECAFCNIADCPDRIEADVELAADGDMF